MTPSQGKDLTEQWSTECSCDKTIPQHKGKSFRFSLHPDISLPGKTFSLQKRKKMNWLSSIGRVLISYGRGRNRGFLSPVETEIHGVVSSHCTNKSLGIPTLPNQRTCCAGPMADHCQQHVHGDNVCTWRWFNVCTIYRITSPFYWLSVQWGSSS